MRLSQKILLVISVLTIVAISAAGITGVFVAKSNLERSYEEKLAAIANGRRNQLETYLEGLDAKLAGLATNKDSSTALNMFKAGIQRIKHSNPTQLLQDLLTVERTHEESLEFYKDTGATVYGTQATQLGPKLKQFAKVNALGDLYFVNKNGLIVYSIAAGDEIATNLKDGPYASTELGLLFDKLERRALLSADAAAKRNAGETVELDDPDNLLSFKDVMISDFAPYELVSTGPVSFVGIAVVDEKNYYYGSIIAQLPISKLAKIMSDRTGLGETGETILVSQDGTLLLDTQFTKDFDPLTTKVDLSALVAIDGRDLKIGLADGYRDITSMISTAQVNYEGADWRIAAVVDIEEALAGLYEMQIGIATVSILLVCGSLLIAFLFARSLTRPINSAIANMKELSSGKTDFELKEMNRKDEVGDIVRSIEKFRQAAIEKTRLEYEAESTRLAGEKQRAADEDERVARSAEVSNTVELLAGGLESLASGNLINTIDKPFMEDMEEVRHNFNASLDKLRLALTDIDSGATSIKCVSSEIAEATEDLSSRTEQQAASLEEAAAAVQELTENIRGGEQQAQEVASFAKSAREDTDQSSKVVHSAMDAMSRIEQASNGISGIINVIDEIAFQTNLLALNAGVEAARAGEAGKGFAVVAQEVRELAGRSAEAAKEIKSLIESSNGEVQEGVKLVKETGSVLEKISSNVSNIEARITKVANGASEQLLSIETVNSSVGQLDQRIQQNAAMAEQTTAATVNLVEEIKVLSSRVSSFKITSEQSSTPNAEMQLIA